MFGTWHVVVQGLFGRGATDIVLFEVLHVFDSCRPRPGPLLNATCSMRRRRYGVVFWGLLDGRHCDCRGVLQRLFCDPSFLFSDKATQAIFDSGMYASL